MAIRSITKVNLIVQNLDPVFGASGCAESQGYSSKWVIRFSKSLSTECHLRLCFVGLSSAGNSVADTCSSHRVHCLHNDKRPLLQRGHGQMPVVWHRLQVGAITRPHRVPHLQNPHLVGPHLKESREWDKSTWGSKKIYALNPRWLGMNDGVTAMESNVSFERKS